MLDKEKLIGFIEVNYKSIEKQIENRNDDFSTIELDAWLKAYAQILFYLKKGDFDIHEKPQETCNREYIPPYSTAQNISNGYYKTTCGIQYSETDIMIEKEYNYCPYCSKTIEVIEDE